MNSKFIPGDIIIYEDIKYAVASNLSARYDLVDNSGKHRSIKQWKVDKSATPFYSAPRPKTAKKPWWRFW